jgi:hypothetical protein
MSWRVPETEVISRRPVRPLSDPVAGAGRSCGAQAPYQSPYAPRWPDRHVVTFCPARCLELRSETLLPR